MGYTPQSPQASSGDQPPNVVPRVPMIDHGDLPNAGEAEVPVVPVIEHNDVPNAPNAEVPAAPVIEHNDVPNTPNAEVPVVPVIEHNDVPNAHNAEVPVVPVIEHNTPNTEASHIEQEIWIPKYIDSQNGVPLVAVPMVDSATEAHDEQADPAKQSDLQTVGMSEGLPIVAVSHKQEAYNSLALRGGASRQAHGRAVKEAHLKDLFREAVHELATVEDTSLSLLQTSMEIIHDSFTSEMDLESDDDQENKKTSKRKKQHKGDAPVEQAEVPEKVQQARQAR